ncbi:bifunctional diguanylate cyclase/phosphodiesterase [Arthrobacter halodurans]|uniref:EAL domain-containing protein n=1 Tax=Arthrobacter halodurans TaxID=516699 RepID=A0ABV4URD1_9MICC
MTRAQELLAADEQQRLEECAREPIHTPGAIQPHGALLVIDPSSMEILQASANTGALLGRDAGLLPGRRLEDAIGSAAAATLRAVIAAGVEAAPNPTVLSVGGRPFDVIVHRADAVAIVEFEPARPWGDVELVALLHGAENRLCAAKSVGDLRAAAAREVRRLTGFEHVMVYHFHPDGHGEVVAEEHAEGTTDYLGLHFPASDIPAQARRLYALKRSSVIATSEDRSAALVPALNPRTGGPTDLSRAELRSVSPHHLRFMRNMGQASSMSLSLVHDGQLIGMITCAHREPRHLPYIWRKGCEILAQRLTLQLGALAESRRLSEQLRKQRLRESLVQRMVAADHVAEALVGGDTNVLDLLGAEGATARIEGIRASAGQTPSDGNVEALVARWRGTAGGHLLVSESLGTDRPDLAELVPGTAGLVLLDLGAGGDYLAWFRSEVSASVDWLGDQSPANRDTPLSPRNSFRMWSQSVAGRAEPWDPVAVAEAGELGRDIDTVLLRRAQARLAHQGLHDALTGLPNRRLMMERLGQALERRDHGAPASVVFIDLDRFKLVNDSFGHDVGDALIVESARRISRSTRGTDTICRLGGDEFLVLCENTDARTAESIAERIVEAFREPLRIDGLELRITVSVGTTTAQEHHRPADLLREADTAMYLSKNEGRNRSSRFTDRLRDLARERVHTEPALRQGIERGELVLFYQPIRDVAEGHVKGVEALVRWNRPGHGMVPPDVFIPLAEDTGIIGQLGEWVMTEAIRQLRRWRDGGLVGSDFHMAVNVSPLQLVTPSLVGVIRRLLAGHGLKPADLTIEITESTMMSDLASISNALRALADYGVALSIDDFGTRYSSLANLRHLPAHQLKIDKSFVAGLGKNRADSTLVETVIGLARGLGMSCVAEGVETAGQMDLLRALGCDLAQGYHLGRPQTGPELTTAWAQPLAPAQVAGN